MRDMLPRKPGTSVTDIKKSLKDSLYSNGMNPPSTSPALRSPTVSRGTDSPSQDASKGINFKPRSDSPHVLKNSEEKNFNSSTNSLSAMMSNSNPAPVTMSPITSSNMTSSAPPALIPGTRSKSSPHPKQNKLRRNHSTEPKSRNKAFEFDLTKLEGQSSSDNFCANNNNNSKHREKSPFNLRHLRTEDTPRASRTPSTNSASDLSPTSLPTTDERAATPSGQNIDNIAIEGAILESPMMNSPIDDKIVEALNDMTDFPDAGGDLELDRVTNSSNLNYPGEFAPTSDDFLFDSSTLRTSQSENPLGSTREQSPVSVSSSTATTPTCAVTHTMPRPLTSSAPSLISSVSSPTFHPESSTALTTTSSYHPKFSPPEGTQVSNQGGKSHLQDILGVTDTIRLQNMARSIDSVPYKSPTTTSYITSIKPHTTPNIPTSPGTLAPPQHKHSSNMAYKPRPSFIYDSPAFRQSHPRGVPPYMDTGGNPPWNRGSPGHLRSSPAQLRSPTFPPTFGDTSVSPTNINPMSGLQSTVDSIPAAPMGTPGPGTPIGNMGPPLTSPLEFDGTPPPSGKMRPPPSPSVTGTDKRCMSVDSVTPTSNGKKSGNKRERTRSADSKEEDKKESSGPKNKRRKSRSKEDNPTGKKSNERTLTRSVSAKGESTGPRLDSALSKMLNPDTRSSNPYLYIFNTEDANRAANLVMCKQVPDIIVYHRSFVGNCKLGQPPHLPLQKQPSAPPSVQMPIMNRSPTEIKTEKNEMTQKSPNMEIPSSFAETAQGINLQDTKPPMMPPATSGGQSANNELFSSQSEPTASTVMSSNGEQNLQTTEELSAEKRRNREDKLGKLRIIEQRYLSDQRNEASDGQRGPGWSGQPVYAMPNMDKVPMDKVPMMGPGMTPENASAEWQNLLQQEYQQQERRRKQEAMPPDVHSRPPPPYQVNGPRWSNAEGYPMERMPMEMNPRFRQMVPHNHRPLTRMPQDPRMQTNYMGPRMVGPPREAYPGPSRMPMYDPYINPHNMMRPPSIASRLPPPVLRQPGVNENYPFSEQLMKQASYYNREPTFEPDPSMMPDWPGQGPEGTQRLSHMPGSTSPGMVGPPMRGLEMEPGINPVDIRMPNPRGYDVGPYPPEMQRYDMIPCSMGSPSAPMDSRMPQYCPNAGGSMMDAMARRGEPRPPDLNLNSQMPPRSPMYHVRGVQPSPNVMTSSIGPRYPAPGEIPHPPQPSPMPGSRSPMQSPGMQYLPMGPVSAGIDQPQVMIGGGPHSAGPMSNPPPTDWTGPSPNLPGSQTPNTMHPMMTSQPGMMTSQPGMMMSSQAGMMTSQPVMISQPGMMTSQPGMPQRQMMRGGKPGPSTLSIMMNEMKKFKMPEQSPLYQEAVKDTASPPPLNHNEPPPLTHSTGGIRMPGPNHPPTYDSRMGPRMPGPQMNEGYQPYSTGHPSPLQGTPLSAGGTMMMPQNMAPDSMPPSSGYTNRPSFGDGGFDLRGILPSEKPSQTISYLPPETNEPFNPPVAWGGEGIRPQVPMQAPMYPTGHNHTRPMI